MTVELILHHRHIVHALARRYGHMFPSMPMEELVAYGNVGLVEAASRYRDVGYSFAHYAGDRIRGSILRGIELYFGWNTEATKRTSVCVADELPEVVQPATPELLIDVVSVVSRLPDNERRILLQVLAGRSLVDISRDYQRKDGGTGCSRGRISHQYLSAVRKLAEVCDV